MPDATIYDVAAKAGVSISTVSRVLNVPEQVNRTTRARVIAAIDELGFVPKAEAISRARKGAGRIGVLAPFFTFPSFVQRLRGVAEQLAGSAYELVIYNVDSTARRDHYFASLPVLRRLDGLIVIALPFDDAAAQRIIAHNLATILIEFTHPLFSSIEINDEEGGRLAARYLIERGHRRCAFVGDSEAPPYALHKSAARLAGFRSALCDAGLQLCDHYIALAPHGPEQARRLTHRLLDLEAPPTAIFTPSDRQAMGVLKAARERGLTVPGDVAVIGFDDLEMADYIGLTTIRQPLEESGRVAVDLLLARLEDRTRPIQHVQLPLSLVVRETA
jgi:LacI family transcriptional regulator